MRVPAVPLLAPRRCNRGLRRFGNVSDVAVPKCLLVSTLVHPEQVSTYALDEWDLLVRQARAAHLLARLFVVLKKKGLANSVPARPRSHFESAWIVAERQREAVHLEVAALRRVLGGLNVPMVLLKGAAYVAADLPAAEGRTLSDIDILVPKQALPAVESALMRSGWMTTNPDAYDQRYYRVWMHEIPPMQHLKRGTMLDVHHAILPESARIRADSEAMRIAAVPVDSAGDTFVLTPADMVLHSATHLFHEGETDKALRDLVDLDSLLLHFSAGRDAFWSSVARSCAAGGADASPSLRAPLHEYDSGYPGARKPARIDIGRRTCVSDRLAYGCLVLARAPTGSPVLRRWWHLRRACGAVRPGPLDANADRPSRSPSCAQGDDAESRPGCSCLSVGSYGVARIVVR